VSSDVSLPPEFRGVLEEEFQKQMQDLEFQSRDQIGEMIDRFRDEATEQVEKLRIEYRTNMERLESARARILRAVESAGEKKFCAVRLSRLEQQVHQKVEQFRHSPEYRNFLTHMVDECRRAGFSGHGVIQCGELETSLLGPEFQGCTVVTVKAEDWGGFILKGEGGALFDCTFHTRWQQYISWIQNSGC
jgi:vacuolar-type H+-ATPase subunit E/Vma4